MKLRVKGDSVRLRLTQTEVADLARGQAVAGHTRLGDSVMTYGVRVAALEGLVVDGLNIWAEVPTQRALDWSQSDDEAMSWDVENGVGHTSIFVEKDFACLKPRGVEDADAFPHPNAGSSKC